MKVLNRFINMLALPACGAVLGLAVSAASAATINIASGGAITSLNPQEISGTWESKITQSIFEGLVTRNAKGEPVLGVAKDYEVSEDGTVYTFHLRDGLKWSDGEPFTAGDFVFSYRRLVDPATAAKYANMLYPIKNARAINTGKEKDVTKLGVSAPDDMTVVIELENVTPYFFELLAHQTGDPLPEHAMEKMSQANLDPKEFVVNGPFKPVEWVPGSKVVLVKNDLYWDAENVALDGVNFSTLEDADTNFDWFRTGKLDVLYGLSSSKLDVARRDFKKEMIITPFPGTYYYAFNTNKKPFDDPRVREALTISIDRNLIVDKVTKTGQIPAYGWVPLGMNNYFGMNYRPEWADWPLEKRRERARKLIKEAGYDTDNPLVAEISYNTLEGHKNIALAIAAMWKSLGVDVKLYNTDVKVHYENLDKGDFEIGRAGWVLDFNDPINFLDLLRTGVSFNYGGWSNEEYDNLLAKADKEADLEKRAELMAAAEKIAMDNFAALPIYFYVSVEMVHQNVSGFYGNSNAEHPVKYMNVVRD